MSVEHAHLTDELAGLNLAQHDGIPRRPARASTSTLPERIRTAKSLGSALRNRLLAGIEMLPHRPLPGGFFHSLAHTPKAVAQALAETSRDSAAGRRPSEPARSVPGHR